MFLKRALQKLLNEQITFELSAKDCQDFKRILIKDSICYQVDPSLAKEYEGSGGSGSEAAIRIQFEFDILSGKITDLSISAFTSQDATNSLATLELTQEGDLIIRDLAYMNLKVLKELIRKGAYFLCRPNPTVKIYEKKGDAFQELNLVKIRHYMNKHNIDTLEKDVYLGSKEKLRVRLILHLMPEDELAERIKKALANNKKKGRGQLTKEYKTRLAFNLFITNAEHEKIPAKNVWSFYRMRWQIELIFKIWKSICHVDKVKKVKKHRFECYLYAKLIFIVISWQVVWMTAKLLFKMDKKPLSFFKAFKTLFNKKMEELRDIFVLGKANVLDFLFRFLKLSAKNHLLEKKKEDEPTKYFIMLSVSK